VDYTTLITGIAAAASAVAVAYIRYRKPKKATTSIQDIADVNTTLNSLVSTGGVDRVMVLHTHNGTGRPSPGFPLKVSSLQTATQLPNLDSLYRDILVDSVYVHTLCDLIEHSKLKITTSDLPPSLLRTVYEREGITHSRWYWLATSNTRIYYITVGATSDRIFHTTLDFTIELAVAHLRSIFSKDKR